MLGFIPQVKHQIFEFGHVICGKLHYKRGRFAFKRGVAHKQYAHYCRNYAEYVHSVGDKVGIAYPERRNYTARNRG